MSAELRIPFRCNADHLATVGELARHLSTDEDRVIARQLALDAAQRADRLALEAVLDELRKR